MPLSKEKIAEYLQNDLAVFVYDNIDSTNNEAKRCAQAHDGVCLYATDHQTAGRGRRGHDFYSPKGTGLYMTLSLPLTAASGDVQKVTCAAAVAACEAIGALCGSRPMIKWVNDIYLGDKKVAGILTEMVTDSDNRPLRVIIGIGINLTTQHFPPAFAERAAAIGDVDPNRLCAAVTDKLIESCQTLSDHSLIEKYKQHNLCIGRIVTYTADGTEHTAVAVDIDDNGCLIVKESDRFITLNSGEISVKL